ncbi:hypothetical protein C1X43_34700, partial [Pseudomonas sp. GW460-C3]
LDQRADLLALFAEPILETLLAGQIEALQQFPWVGERGCAYIGDVGVEFAHIDIDPFEVQPNLH